MISEMIERAITNRAVPRTAPAILLNSKESMSQGSSGRTGGACARTNALNRGGILYLRRSTQPAGATSASHFSHPSRCPDAGSFRFGCDLHRSRPSLHGGDRIRGGLPDHPRRLGFAPPSCHV